jgi:hypothetical protein
VDLLFVKGAEVIEPGCRAPDRSGINSVARGGWDAADRFRRAWLFIDTLDDLFDPTADRAILLRSEHRDLARPFLQRQRQRAILFEALDAFLDALEPIERALQSVLCRAADRRARRFFPTLEFFIKGAAHNAGIGNLGIAKLAGLMDLIATQTKIGRRCRTNIVGTSNDVGAH